MPSHRQPSDPIRDLLEEAESELGRRLREACEAEEKGVSTSDTEEIRRLEDALLSAAMAAEQALAARRHLRRDPSSETAQPIDRGPQADRKSPTSPGGPRRDSVIVGDSESSPGSLLREFEDAAGRMWRAWPVTPGLARVDETGQPRLGEFQEGWICFEALDKSGRRRLAGREPRWPDLRAEELQRLLERSIDAPERRKSTRQSVGGEPASEERHH